MLRPTRFYSSKQEKQIAKAINGRTVSNSGATPFMKGDVTSDLFLIEAKTKVADSKSFSIKKEWIEKIKEEAFAMDRPYSALCFDFGTGTSRYYVIDEKTFKLMLSLLREAEDN